MKKNTVLATFILFSLMGCAQQPLKDYETEDFKQQYEIHCQQGCTLVPDPVMNEILRRLQKAQGIFI